MTVKSFEVADNEEFGDILSRTKKNKDRSLRVGIICGGWFEWYGMFSDSDLEAKIRDDAQRVVQNLTASTKDKCHIVYPGMVDTLDNACEAGETFSRERVDVVVIVENTYVTDFIPLEVLEHLPNVPIIVFSTQATRSLPLDMDNIETVRYEGLVGISQLIGAFRKMGRSYKVVVGASDDMAAYEKIAVHLQVLDICKKLRRMDFGLLGHTFRGMYDIEVDKTKLKGAIGPNVMYVDAQHFVRIWKEIGDDEVTDYRNQIDAAWPIEKYNVEDEDIIKSLRVGLALKKLVLRFNLDAVSVLGQHHLEIATRASTDFAHYTVEEIGCMHTCEGDMANLAMKKVLHLLGESTPVFLEWTAFDEPADTLLLTHHGVVDPRLCADIKKARWTPSPEKWDFTGNGLSIEYCGKAGPATLASFIDEKDGWKLLISEGECVEAPQRPCFAPQFHFRHKMKVTEFMEAILAEGVAHHVCLAYGGYRRHLELLADHLGIRKVYI